MKNIQLVIINPQVDFCDPNGALYVAGAENDMSRLADMIHRLTPKLADIHVTLDCHHTLDIAHPRWWKDSSGNNPNPFTVITATEVENMAWTTTIPSLRQKSLSYLKDLEASGRYPHVVWPEHCLIGSNGNNVYPCVFDAIKHWEEQRAALVDFVSKGSNPFTEHFSAVQAEIPDPNDPSTQVNTRFISTLEQADTILLAGEAGSHCLAHTVRDIVSHFSDPQYVQKLVLLTDATSPVGGFEALQDQFISDMVGLGMQTSTTTDFLS